MCSKDIISPQDRADCGGVGITETQCKSKHNGRCCYDDSVNGVPWCYFGKFVRFCFIYIRDVGALFQGGEQFRLYI